MAEHFMESDIEEFSDAFGLFVTDKKRRISNKEEMKHIMRSLGYSPTIREIDYYYGKYSKDGIIDFATFLQAMYEHSQKEKCEQEIRAGFMSQDRSGTGQISANELWHMLTNFGEKLTRQEAESLFTEVGIKQGGSVDYNKIIYKLLPRVGES